MTRKNELDQYVTLLQAIARHNGQELRILEVSEASNAARLGLTKPGDEDQKTVVIYTEHLVWKGYALRMAQDLFGRGVLQTPAMAQFIEQLGKFSDTIKDARPRPGGNRRKNFGRRPGF